jgi:hypothetical protein
MRWGHQRARHAHAHTDPHTYAYTDAHALVYKRLHTGSSGNGQRSNGLIRVSLGLCRGHGLLASHNQLPQHR